MSARAVIVSVVALVVAACASGPGDADAGFDAGCPGPPPPCCSGACNGDVVVPPRCGPEPRWICPRDSVSAEDCADAGVRWCSGAPVLDAG